MRGKREIVVVTAVCLVIGLSSLGSAAGFFSVFRKEKSNAWAIDPSDFVKLAEAIEGHNSVVQIANFGVIEILSPPLAQEQSVSKGQFVYEGQRIGFPLALTGYSEVDSQFISAAKIRFTLYTAPINRFLSSLSIRAMVPPEINNKPFLLQTAPLVALSYHPREPLKSDLVIAVTRASELEIPPSVDQESLRKAIVAIPGLPKGLQSQFANVSYNGKPLIDPEGIGEPVEIKAGVHGAFTSGPKEVFKGLEAAGAGGQQVQLEIQKALNQKDLINGLWGMRFRADCLIWLDDGLIYMVMGQLTEEQAVEIARMVG